MDNNKYSELRDKIEKILNDNITHYPYEGTEIDKREIIQEVIDLIKLEKSRDKE